MNKYSQLPDSVPAIRYAVQDTKMEGYYEPARLKRLIGMVKAASKVALNLHFFEQGKLLRCIDVNVVTAFELTCQRCLEQMTYEISKSFQVNLWFSQDFVDEKGLGSGDWLANEHGDLSLKQYIEDELILSIPFAPVHDEGICEIEERFQIDDETITDQVNQFAALKRMFGPDR